MEWNLGVNSLEKKMVNNNVFFVVWFFIIGSLGWLGFILVVFCVGIFILVFLFFRKFCFLLFFLFVEEGWLLSLFLGISVKFLIFIRL